MSFTIERSVEILERTPLLLHTWLCDISEDWTSRNEGGESWSVFDIVGHLVHGEKTDWMERTEIILSRKADKTFQPFDRMAQFTESRGKTLRGLLDEFKRLREENLGRLRAKNLTAGDLEEKGFHPALGEVTLTQLLSAWTVHDLNHIAQISRVMARQYKPEVGPWIEYLKILNL